VEYTGGVSRKQRGLVPQRNMEKEAAIKALNENVLKKFQLVADSLS